MITKFSLYERVGVNEDVIIISDFISDYIFSKGKKDASTSRVIMTDKGKARTKLECPRSLVNLWHSEINQECCLSSPGLILPIPPALSTDMARFASQTSVIGAQIILFFTISSNSSNT